MPTPLKTQHKWKCSQTKMSNAEIRPGRLIGTLWNKSGPPKAGHVLEFSRFKIKLTFIWINTTTCCHCIVILYKKIEVFAFMWTSEGNFFILGIGLASLVILMLQRKLFVERVERASWSSYFMPETFWNRNSCTFVLWYECNDSERKNCWLKMEFVVN